MTALAFETTTVTPDTLPSDFDDDTVKVYKATTFNDEEWPGRGVLVVYGCATANIGVTQELHAAGHVYVRHNATSSTWDPWYELDRTAL